MAQRIVAFAASGEHEKESHLFFQVSLAHGKGDGRWEPDFWRRFINERYCERWRCGGFELLARRLSGSGIKASLLGNISPIIVVEDALVVELKCVERIGNEHVAQCLNYLRASGRKLCLLVNFQKPNMEWRRIVLGLGDSG